MMRMKDFVAWMSALRKRRAKEPLSNEERALLAKHGVPPKKICSNARCRAELGPRVDGEHRRVAGQVVCDDCYYDSVGEVVEKYPPMPLGIRVR